MGTASLADSLEDISELCAGTCNNLIHHWIMNLNTGKIHIYNCSTLMWKFTSIALVQLFCKSLVLQYYIKQSLKNCLACALLDRNLSSDCSNPPPTAARARTYYNSMYTCTHYAVTCDYLPTQLLHRPVVMVTGSERPLIMGQFITYTCPPGFVLIGPNMSVCMENREWEPDPGKLDCIGKWILSLIIL